ERIRHQYLRGVEVEGVKVLDGHIEDRRQDRGGLLARRVGVTLNERQEPALLGVDGFLRDAQRRHGRLQGWIVAQRALDQGIERGRSEHPPPLLRNIPALHKALRLAGRCVRRRRPWGKRLRRIAVGLRGRRIQKVWPDGDATRQQCSRRQRGG